MLSPKDLQPITMSEHLLIKSTYTSNSQKTIKLCHLYKKLGKTVLPHLILKF